jgi:hypothetical protein
MLVLIISSIRTHNPKVTGSSPALAIKKAMPKCLFALILSGQWVIECLQISPRVISSALDHLAREPHLEKPASGNANKGNEKTVVGKLEGNMLNPLYAQSA